MKTWFKYSFKDAKGDVHEGEAYSLGGHQMDLVEDPDGTTRQIEIASGYRVYELLELESRTVEKGDPAKSVTERVQDYRARMRAQGLKEIRNLWAYPADEERIKDYAAKTVRKRQG